MGTISGVEEGVVKALEKSLACRAAVSLRLAGAPFDEIAEVLGLSSADAARQKVELGLAAERWDDEQRDALRAEEASRILALLKPMWSKATDPDDPEHIPAAKTALQFIDRHARLLGLDAPTEVVVHNPTTSEIDQWVASVLQQEHVFTVVEADPVRMLED